MKTETQKLVESIQGKLTESEGSLFICLCDALQYDIYAVGSTKEEAQQRLTDAFISYVEKLGHTFNSWIEFQEEDFEDYGNDPFRFITEYHGTRTYDISKGYAFGWE